MSQTAKKVWEYVIIILFLLIVVSLIGIQTYRYVIHSDWYSEKKARESFSAITEKLQSEGSIDSLAIYKTGASLRYFPFDDPLLFSNLCCEEFFFLEDEEAEEIYSLNSITVFFLDGTQTHFFVSDENELFWGSLKIECPALLAWYGQRI